MAERVVKVTVTAAVNSYLSGMDQVAKKTREGRTEAEALTAKLEAQRKAFQVTGAAMVTAGGLIAAGLFLATKRAADFDQAMSNVAATGEDARGSIDALREAAIEAGAETVFSARESAGAIEELAKAGISAQDILAGGLTGALNLAAAGGIEVAQAAEIASNTLNQFNLAGSDATHIADVLAAGAGKASGGVDDLGQALAQTGQVAAAMGLSVEETTAGLAAFASAGLKGSDAGTSFKTMLGALTPNSARAADEMKRLGVNAFDSQGQFIGLEKFAGNLHESLKGLTVQQRQASLEIMFGSDAVRAGIELYNQGEAGIRKWISAVDDQGYAAETAATRLDNLNGDLEKLSGAFDSALISVGEAGQGPLRALVQGLTEVVDSFNAMPEGGQVAVYWVGAVGAAAALSGGAFLLAVPKVAAYKVAIAELGPAAQSASRALGNIARVGGGVVAGFTGGVIAANLLIEAFKNTGLHGEELANRIATASDAVALFDAQSQKTFIGSSNLKIAAAQVDALGGALDALRNGTKGDLIDIQTITNVQRLGNDLAKLAQTDMPQAQRQFALLAEQAGLNKTQQLQLLEIMEPYNDAVTKQATANGEAASAAKRLQIANGDAESQARSSSDAYREQADEVEGVRQALRDLIDQINAANSVEQQAIQANADWLEGLAGITAEVESQRKAFQDANGTLDGFTVSLDESTASGSANAAMLAGLANDAQTAAAAQFEVDQKTMSADDASRKYAATLAEQRRKFEESATAAGFNAGQVKALADRIFAMPTSREVDIIADTAPAQGAIDALITANSNRKIWIKTAIDRGASDAELMGMVGVGRAAGGILPGPPSSRDNMIAAVASGEFIVRASQVIPPENRRVLEFINAGGRMRGFAEGGYVQPQYAPSGGGWRSSSADTATAPIYVQNPFTGEYLLAQVSGVASGVAVSVVKDAVQPFKGGRR